MLFSCCYFTTTTAILDFHNHLQSSLLLCSLSPHSQQTFSCPTLWRKYGLIRKMPLTFSLSPNLSLSCLHYLLLSHLWKISASFFPNYLFLYICELKEIVIVFICYSFLSHLVLTHPHGWNWAYLEDQCFSQVHFSILKWTWSVCRF